MRKALGYLLLAVLFCGPTVGLVLSKGGSLLEAAVGVLVMVGGISVLLGGIAAAAWLISGGEE